MKWGLQLLFHPPPLLRLSLPNPRNPLTPLDRLDLLDPMRPSQVRAATGQLFELASGR